jgi:hypothetical protein
VQVALDGRTAYSIRGPRPASTSEDPPCIASAGPCRLVAEPLPDVPATGRPVRGPFMYLLALSLIVITWLYLRWSERRLALLAGRIATILAVVAGLVISASGAVAHDFWNNVVRRCHMEEHGRIAVARIAAGFLGCVLGTVLSGRRAADALFAELRVRSETGMGAEAVAPRPA